MSGPPVFQLVDFVASPTQEPVNISLAAGELAFLKLPRGERRAFLRAVVTCRRHQGRMLLPPDGLEPGTSPVRLVIRQTPPRNRVAVWLEEPPLPALTAAEALLFSARTAGTRLYNKEGLLKPLGLEEDGPPAGRLSGLKKAKLALAVALAAEPVALLADDPLGGFDADLRQPVFDLLPSLLGPSCCLYLENGG